MYLTLGYLAQGMVCNLARIWPIAWKPNRKGCRQSWIERLFLRWEIRCKSRGRKEIRRWGCDRGLTPSSVLPYSYIFYETILWTRPTRFQISRLTEYNCSVQPETNLTAGWLPDFRSSWGQLDQHTKLVESKPTTSQLHNHNQQTRRTIDKPFRVSWSLGIIVEGHSLTVVNLGSCLGSLELANARGNNE